MTCAHTCDTYETYGEVYWTANGSKHGVFVHCACCGATIR